MIKQILSFFLCIFLFFGNTRSEVLAAGFIENSRTGDMSAVEISSNTLTLEDADEKTDDSEKSIELSDSTEMEAQEGAEGISDTDNEYQDADSVAENEAEDSATSEVAVESTQDAKQEENADNLQTILNEENDDRFAEDALESNNTSDEPVNSQGTDGGSNPSLEEHTSDVGVASENENTYKTSDMTSEEEFVENPPHLYDGYATGDDYPYKNYAMSGYDEWGFVFRNCTSFVAWCLNSRNGVNFTNNYQGVQWGWAGNWGTAARSVGITVDMNPTVGSVAWISSGHVAWVKAVNGDNVDIEEYNWNDDGLFHTITWPKTHYSGFIHIADLGGTAITPAYLGEDFYAFIIQRNDWRHLGVNGYNIEAVANDPFDPKQIWRCTRQSDGSYIFSNMYWENQENTTWLLNCDNSGSTPGTNVTVWKNNGSAAQRWFAYETPTGLKIVPAYCSLALDMAGGGTTPGTNVQLWESNDCVAQRFDVYHLSNDNATYERPGKPSASVYNGKTEASVGETVSLKWTESPKVNIFDKRSYRLQLFDNTGKEVLNKPGLTGTSFDYSFEQPGTYSVQITAINDYYIDMETASAKTTITVKNEDIEPPVVSNLRVKEASLDGITLEFDVSDNDIVKDVFINFVVHVNTPKDYLVRSIYVGSTKVIGKDSDKVTIEYNKDLIEEWISNNHLFGDKQLFRIVARDNSNNISEEQFAETYFDIGPYYHMKVGDSITTKDLFGIDKEWELLYLDDGSLSISQDEAGNREYMAIKPGKTLLLQMDTKHTQEAARVVIVDDNEANDVLVLKELKAVSHNKINVSWEACQDVDGYIVYRKTGKEDFSVVKTVTDPNTTSITNVAASGVTYTYKVAAYKDNNGSKTIIAESEERNATALPAAPAMKSAGMAAFNKIKVIWTKVSGCAGYVIYRSTEENGNYSVLKTVTMATATEYSNIVHDGQTYYYKIRAFVEVNGKKVYGDYSEVLSGDVIDAPPANFRLEQRTATKIIFNWDKVEDSEGYVIYRYFPDTNKCKAIKNITSNDTLTYTYKVEADTDYVFTMRAFRVVNGKKVYSDYTEQISN